MITKNNITEVMNLITEKEVNEVMNSKCDYIGLSVSSYGIVTLEIVNGDEELEEQIISGGGLICDKDEFLRLYVESESINPFLLELIK